MLEDLDKVDWGRLRHAYGPAADVPKQLFALTSPSREAREDAWHALHGNLWHQGTVYEATAHAVPFLIQLASGQDIPDRHQIIAYIGLIGRGRSFLDAHQDLAHYEAQRMTPSFREEFQQELGWVRDVRQAVLQGATTYAGLLDDAQPRVRATAGYLLALLHEEAESHLGWLRSRLVRGELDDLIRATLVFCLGHLAATARHEETVGFLERLAVSDLAPSVRITAVLGLARCVGTAIPIPALAAMVDGTNEPHGTETIFHEVLYEDEDFWSWYGEALCRCGSYEQTIPAILAILDKSDNPESIIEALLIAMLDDRPLGPGIHVSELRTSQILALQGIGRCEGLWIGADKRIDRYRNVSTHGAVAILHYFGLPGRHRDFQSFIEGKTRSGAA